MRNRILIKKFLQDVTNIDVEHTYHLAWRRLYAALPRKGGKLSQQEMKAISSLSPSNFKRFVTKANDLYMSGQLSRASLLSALSYVNREVPAIPESTVVYKKKHSGVATERKLDNGLSIFSPKGASREDNPDNKSGYDGIVSPAYKWPVFGEPHFVMKRLSKDNEELRSDLSAAQREAAGLKLVGREVAEWYDSKKGAVVVTDYLPGETLQDLYEADFDFKQYSQAQRLKLFATLLGDCQVLHENGQTHGYASPANIMKCGKALKLIHFSTMRKFGSSQPGDDMQMLGYSLAIVFPELFRLLLSGGETSVIKMKMDDLTNMDIAIMNLMDAFMEHRQEYRCTAKMAKQCCLALADKAVQNDFIDDAALMHILKTTINRDDFTVEDSLLGSRRPEKFAEGYDQTGGYARMLGVEGVTNAKAFTALFRVSRKSQLTAKVTIIDKIVENKLKK